MVQIFSPVIWQPCQHNHKSLNNPFDNIIIVSARSKQVCSRPYIDKLQACFMSCSKLFCCLLASIITTSFMVYVTCCNAVSWCHANQHGNISTKMLIAFLLHWWPDYLELSFKISWTSFLLELHGPLLILVDRAHSHQVQSLVFFCFMLAVQWLWNICAWYLALLLLFAPAPLKKCWKQFPVHCTDINIPRLNSQTK